MPATETDPARTAAAGFAARLDRVPISRFHLRVLLLSGLGWMFDALDILIVGSIIAAVSEAWGLEAGTALWISSLNLFGMFFGATLAGTLADRFGRKAMFQATLLIYSVFTGLSALAFNAVSLMVLRFLSGIGLGGELPVASTLVAEFAPTRRRGALVVLLESFWAYGAVLAALVGYVVVPREFGFLAGWQVALLIGALPAFLVFALRRGLPESVRFLVGKGRIDEAERVVREIEEASGVEPPAGGETDGWPGERAAAGAMGGSGPETESDAAVPGAGAHAGDPPSGVAADHTDIASMGPGVAVDERTASKPRLRELFSSAFRRRTAVLWTMWATMSYSYYGIFLWLPLQFVRKGFALDQALLYNLVIAVAQIPGYFTAAYLVDRWGRKRTFLVFLLLCAVGAYFFGQEARLESFGPENVRSILIWGSVISFFNLGAWGVVYSYTPEQYPTRLRGTGSGAASSFGRIWAFIAPLSIGWQISLFGGDATVFFVFMGVMLVGAVLVLLFGEETMGRSLEEVAAA